MSTITIREGLDGAAVPDTYIYDAQSTNNFGSSASLVVGVLSGPSVARLLIAFDLSPIPDGSVIDSATLRIRCSVAAASAEPAYAYRLTQPGWLELQVTWEVWRALMSWSAPGGDYTTDDGVVWTLPTSTGDFDIDNLAVLVTDAIANRASKLHLLLRRLSEGGAEAYAFLRSGEWSTGEERPRLIVNYTEPTCPRAESRLTELEQPMAAAY